MKRAWLVAVALLLPVASGCLGGVTPAEIPKSTLNQQGWSQTSSTSESLVAGMGEKVTKEYRPNGGTDLTGVIVVSVNDVPILDESRFIPQALEQVEEKRNIQLNEAGSTTLTLINLDGSTDADLYDFQKSGASGKAVLFTPNCSSFVVVVGYGVTGAGGISGFETTYQEAKNTARGVAC